MYAGQVVEVAGVESIFARPAHPYTQGLIASIPGRASSGELYAIPGSVPSPIDPPPGCRFRPRCPHAAKTGCGEIAPEMVRVAPDHSVACHLFTQGGLP